MKVFEDETSFQGAAWHNTDKSFFSVNHKRFWLRGCWSNDHFGATCCYPLSKPYDCLTVVFRTGGICTLKRPVVRKSVRSNRDKFKPTWALTFTRVDYQIVGIFYVGSLRFIAVRNVTELDSILKFQKIYSCIRMVKHWIKNIWICDNRGWKSNRGRQNTD